MAAKNVDDLDEKSRTVHIHLFRLARFVRYLKEHHAEIKIYDLQKVNAISYKANAKKDNPSLESLIDMALKKDRGYAKDLLSRKLTAKDTHSNKERGKELGSTLMGITIQKKCSTEDIGSVRLKDIHYRYCPPNNSYKTLEANLKSNDLSPKSGRVKIDFFDEKLKNHLKIDINASIEGFIALHKCAYSGIYLSEFPLFEAHSHQLDIYLRQKTNGGKPPSDIKEIANELLKLTRVYNRMIDLHNIRVGILPGYVDCSIFSSPEMADRALCNSYEGSVSNLIGDPKSVSTQTRLRYRYEIMHKLVERDPEEKVGDWPAVYKALLIFCNFELSGLHSLLRDHLHNELPYIRYTVLTKNSLDDKKSEKSRLSAKQLSVELKNYFITDPLEEMLKMRDGQLLSKPIYKYGEEEAIANHISKDEIWGRLHQISKGILREKIISDLHMSDNLLPKDRESLFQY